MNKTELINAIAEKTGVAKTDIDKVINAGIEAITETLQTGDKVRLIGFGTFEPRFKKATSGFNPSTKEKISIPAKTVAKFVPGKALADAVVNVSEKKILAAKNKK